MLEEIRCIMMVSYVLLRVFFEFIIILFKVHLKKIDLRNDVKMKVN